MRARPLRLRRPDDGSISLFVAISAAALVVVIGIVLDCGGRLRAKERADACAQEVARTLGQQLDQTALLRDGEYVVITDRKVVDGTVQRYLKECPPYKLQGAVSFPDKHTVTVDVTTGYDTALLGGIGINSLPVQGRGTATLVHGVTNPEN